MKIDSKQELAGVPILEVRSFLRKHASWGFERSAIEDAFDLERGSRLLAVLLGDGYIVEEHEREFVRYAMTLKGGALARATAAKMVRRETAERALAQFLVRCAQVRGRDDLLFVVSRVVLFGSMLSTTSVVSDVDLAVALAPKEPDPERHHALAAAQARAAIAEGRTFSNIIEEFDYARRRVLVFLKARSRVLQFSPPDDEVLKQAAQRVIYEEPRTDSGPPVSGSTGPSSR